MPDDIVAHIAAKLYHDGKLTRQQAFALSVVEHVIGSQLYYVPGGHNTYTEQLIAALSAEQWLICGTLFERIEAAGLVRRTAICTDDALHRTLNIIKQHCSDEWVSDAPT